MIERGEQLRLAPEPRRRVPDRGRSSVAALSARHHDSAWCRARDRPRPSLRRRAAHESRRTPAGFQAQGTCLKQSANYGTSPCALVIRRRRLTCRRMRGIGSTSSVHDPDMAVFGVRQDAFVGGDERLPVATLRTVFITRDEETRPSRRQRCPGLPGSRNGRLQESPVACTRL